MGLSFPDVSSKHFISFFQDNALTLELTSGHSPEKGASLHLRSCLPVWLFSLFLIGLVNSFCYFLNSVNPTVSYCMQSREYCTANPRFRGYIGVMQIEW